MEDFTNGFSFKDNFNLITFNIFRDFVKINRSFRVKITFRENEDIFKIISYMALGEQFITVEVECEK